MALNVQLALQRRRPTDHSSLPCVLYNDILWTCVPRARGVDALLGSPFPSARDCGITLGIWSVQALHEQVVDVGRPGAAAVSMGYVPATRASSCWCWTQDLPRQAATPIMQEGVH